MFPQWTIILLISFFWQHKHFISPPCQFPLFQLVCAPWPKATVKSPVGAYIFTLYFLLPWTPCPALSLPCPCTALPLPLPCPVSNLPFAARDRRRKLHRERAVFFFLLLPGTGGGSYTGNSSSSSSPMGGSAPLDFVTVGGGVRFDSSLVAGMDETSVRLDGWRFGRAESGVASPKAFIYRL